MPDWSAAALDAAKAKVGKPAKHTLAAVRRFTERAEALLATPATVAAASDEANGAAACFLPSALVRS